MNEISNPRNLILEMQIEDGKFDFTSSIDTALSSAYSELQVLDETIESLEKIKPNCDKLDYALATGSGALCGLIDIFLIGKPGESPLGEITDKWFEDRTKDFAKLCGWSSNNGESSTVAIRFLENKFKIPYDQRGAGDAASFVFGLSPSNHHFKSLAHNPTLLGLFCSILDQFSNSSHFVTDCELISLVDADGKFYLRGNSVPEKLFCAFANWFGHLISDMSGSSNGKGRGVGIPSPIWAWTNDIIAVKRKLNISPSTFDKTISELALNIYKQGYDVRFQTTQAIPVFINEVVVRFFYAIRRMLKFFSKPEAKNQSFHNVWIACEPFSNPTVKRMLTVAHGTFCLLDLGDATIRGIATGTGSFYISEFIMRLNIVGVGRFAISLYGETMRGISVQKTRANAEFAKRKVDIVEDYLQGLLILSDRYDDTTLSDFVLDLQNSDMYLKAFQKSVLLAEKRNAPPDSIMRSKSDIDFYFQGDMNNV